MELVTDRLVLREWQPADAPLMAAINTDPEVTRYLNRPVDAAAVEAFYDVVTRHWQTHGFGPWVVEARDARGLLGFAGLMHVPPFLAEAGPSPELGWRLAPSAWGRGFATEAAAAARDDAFARLGLSEIISIIHPENARSRRVAVKLGMRQVREIDNPVIGRRVDIWQQAVGEAVAAPAAQP